LHLYYADEEHVEPAATALPGLRSLDITMYAELLSKSNALAALSKLSNLQSLGMYVDVCRYSIDGYWDRAQILTKLPQVAKAVERGVHVNVSTCMDELLGVFDDSWWSSRVSAWGKVHYI
jgi:hypothetical protein